MIKLYRQIQSEHGELHARLACGSPVTRYAFIPLPATVSRPARLWLAGLSLRYYPIARHGVKFLILSILSIFNFINLVDIIHHILCILPNCYG